MTQHETNIRRCKICQQFKPRIFLKKSGKDKIYVDETGLRYNGNVCGACHQVKAKEIMRKLRAEKRDVNA